MSHRSGVPSDRLASGARSPLPDAAAESASGRAIRVGFVVHILGVAGTEALVAATIRRLGPAIEPTVLCLDGVGQLGEELQSEGVDVVALNRQPGVDWRLAARMADQIRRRRLDVVHAHQYAPFFYSAVAKILCRGSFRLILTEHGRHYPDVVSWQRRSANRLVLARLADAVNACSRFSGDALSQRDGFAADRIEIIENGIALDDYGRAADREAARRELGLDEETRYVAMIGRLHPVKDHDTMLQAFRDVAQRRPDVELLLVGDGPLRSELEARASSLGIEDRVRFMGVRRDVPRILGVCDIFALTSLTEAASLTLLEAMASGVPVVITDVGGNPEIVSDGVEGRLVPRGDHAAVADAIVDLLDAPEVARSMGDAGSARVKQHYDLERTISRYGDLYSRLTARGDTPVGHAA